MTKKELLEKLSSITIEHTQFKCALTTLQDSFDKVDATKSSSAVMILGESGVGKTTVLKKYESILSGDEINVVSISLLTRITSKSLAEQLILKIDSQYKINPRATEVSMTESVIGLIRAKNIRVIILDEFQHLLTRTNTKLKLDIANWLKSLMNSLQVLIVIAGMPNSKEVIQDSEEAEQLKRRVVAAVELKPYSTDTKKETIEFVRFLKSFSDKVHEIDTSMFLESDIYTRIFKVSSGNLDRLCKILTDSILFAFDENKKKVEKKHIDASIEKQKQMRML